MREATYTGTAAFPSDTFAVTNCLNRNVHLTGGGHTYMDIPHTIMEVCSLKEH